MNKRKSTLAVPLGLGSRIRAAREAQGWTQPELGRLVGVSKSAVNQWESGAVQNLRLGNLFTVAQALGVDVRELVFGEGVMGGIADQPERYAGISAEQRSLLHLYDGLSREVQQHLRGLMLALFAAGRGKPQD